MKGKDTFIIAQETPAMLWSARHGTLMMTFIPSKYRRIIGLSADADGPPGPPGRRGANSVEAGALPHSTTATSLSLQPAWRRHSSSTASMACSMPRPAPGRPENLSSTL